MTITQKTRILYRKRLAMFLVWLLAFLAFSQCTWTAYAQNQEQTNQYQQACMILEQTENKVSALADTTNTYLQGIVLDSLDSKEIMEKSKQTITRTQQFLQLPMNGPGTSIFLLEHIQMLQSATETVISRTEQLTELYKELQNIPDIIQNSQMRKQIQDATTTLQKICDEALLLLQDSDGQVANENTRTNLKSVADSATAFLKENSEKLTDYQTHQKNVQDAMNAVTASIEEQERILEEQRKQEEAARQEAASQTPNQPTETTPAEDIWYVEYYNDFWGEQADPNGKVTQWAPNYFIAHDWSANGKRIASKPDFVVIDGIKYKYIDCQTFGRQVEFFANVVPFALRNNGIGFQTCYGPELVLITHYEPV